MNREFKFRFWNNNDKTMEHETSVENGWGIGMNGCFRNLAEFGIVIMQYTGIKDRKGKEIFEGDILENKVYGGTWQVCWARKDWDYAGFVLRSPVSNSDNLMLFKDKENLEVVGNIYQNLELLK